MVEDKTVNLNVQKRRACYRRCCVLEWRIHNNPRMVYNYCVQLVKPDNGFFFA